MNRVKELRIAKGLMQKDLADIVNISSPYLSDIENGNRNGSYKIQVKIAKALGLKRRDVFKEDDEEEEEENGEVKQVG